MKRMSPYRAMEFLREGTRTGKIATVRDDGRPHVVPIWYVIDDGDVVFTTWHTSVKLHNLRRDGWAAVAVDDEALPFSYLMVEGPVEISDDPDELLRIATATGARYMGEDRAEEFGLRNGVAGEVVVRLRIDRFVGHDEVAG
jgi:PPOX class probable F420-dependent enzyme